ncbi:MAG: hypothetical protein HOP04_13540 [Methylophilaceae bacterium]|nr:hypothetical protein [Methylophilaceae bacterium]
MNIDEQIEAMLNSRVKVRDIAEMDLRSIFRKHYDGFNKIRMHANMYSRSFQDEHLTYAKLIQELLTQNNIVQKNGNAISLVHIRNEMSAVGREIERKQKSQKIETTLKVDELSSALAEVNVAVDSGKSASSVIQSKSVLANEIEVTPVEITDYEGESALVQSELVQLKNNGVALVWRGEDEYSMRTYSGIAKMNHTKISRLLEKRLLVPMLNTHVEKYFFAWLIKAKHCGRLE